MSVREGKIDEGKLAAFGKMVFGLITDLQVQGGTGYCRRKVTFPVTQDRSVKGSVEIFVVSSAALADLIEKTIASEYSVADVPVSEKVQ